MSVPVPKCCPPGLSFYNSSKCLNATVDFIPKIYTFSKGGGQPVVSSAVGFGYTAEVPRCRRYVLSAQEEWYLMDDLTIFLPDRRPIRANFCLENFHGGLGPLPVVCFDSSETPFDDPQLTVVQPVGMLLSLPFMFATILVYAFLPQLRNVHGKTVVSHVFAFMVGYALLATVQITIFLDTVACIVLGHAIQYFFSAGFFWSNVMSFDIYCTFSGVMIMTGPGRSKQLKKFLQYSVYAWGLPLVILCLTILFDNTNILPPGSHFKPGIGNMDCFFEHGAARWVYFNGPIALVIGSNCYMFLVTACKIFGHQKHMAVFSSPDSNRHSKEKDRFGRYLKLFVVMGINWLAELTSWLVGGPDHIWYFTDVTNTLQGVFIFVILIWKRRNWKLIKARFRELGWCSSREVPGRTKKMTTTWTGWSTPQTPRSRLPPGADQEEALPLDTLHA